MKLSRHHLIPSSREGTDDEDNLVTLPMSWHGAWHQLFHNMTTDEAIAFIRKVMQPHGHWTPKELNKLRNRMKGGKDG